MSDNVTKMHPSGKKGMGQRWMLLAGIVLAAAIVAALYFFRDTDNANASGETVSTGAVDDAFPLTRTAETSMRTSTAAWRLPPYRASMCITPTVQSAPSCKAR